MPPKLPQMKFKPKLVKIQEENVAEHSDGHDALLAIRQEERLQRAQQELLDVPFNASSPPEEEERSTPVTRSTEAAGPPTRTAAGHGSRREDKGSGSGWEASNDRVPFHTSEVPVHATPLPAETLHQALTGRDGVEDLEDRGQYRPVPLEGGGRSVGRTSAPPALDDVDGVAFLKAMDRERKESYQHNRDFYHNVLHPSCGGSSDGLDSRSSSGKLLWLQLPRLHGRVNEPRLFPFDLSQLPPGKIGELKVYESGRMTLDINGCCFDVTADDPEDGSSCCSVAALTSKAATPNGTSVETCHLLDLLSNKLICTPTIEEEN